MARKVRCAVTGHCGRSDEFIKIGDRYYQSQAVYDADQARKDKRKELIAYIWEETLTHEEGQVFPTLLTQKLKEFEFYPDEVILRTVRACGDSLCYQFNQSGKFKGDNSRIFYLFAVIKNHINDEYAHYKEECKAERNAERQSAEAPDDLEVMDAIGTQNTRQSKDLSQFLMEDM